MNITASSILVLGLFGSLAACGGNTLEGGSANTASPVEAETSEPGTPGELSAARVEAARVACDAPHGPIDPTSTATETKERLVGAWYLCSEPNVYYLTKSIEFRADGTFVVLADDGAGGLKRAQGLGSEGEWAPQDGSPWITPGPMLPEFEKAPRRLRITVATSGFQNWFVPL